MLRALLWKEWHEQRWKAAFGCMILGAFVGIGLKTRLGPDWFTVTASGGAGGMLLATLIAMGLAAPERGEGSLDALFALPERPWRILCVKLAVGAAVLLAPFAVMTIMAEAMAAGREMSASRLGSIYLASAGFALALMIWAFCLSVGQPSEARVGLIAMGVVLLWFVWLGFGDMAVDHGKPNSWYWLGNPLVPYILFTDPDTPNQLSLSKVLAANFVFLAPLLAWAMFRFGRLGRSAK